MNNEAMIQQHAAEIARHAKAIQELQAPKPDRTLDYIMLNGACRIHHAVASVIDRHAQLWRLEQMAMLVKTEIILARMERADPYSYWLGTQWTSEQMAGIGRRSTFKPHNMIRSRINDAENRRLANFARNLANDTSHHGALHGRGSSRFWSSL